MLMTILEIKGDLASFDKVVYDLDKQNDKDCCDKGYGMFLKVVKKALLKVFK